MSLLNEVEQDCHHAEDGAGRHATALPERLMDNRGGRLNVGVCVFMERGHTCAQISFSFSSCAQQVSAIMHSDAAPQEVAGGSSESVEVREEVL